MKFFIFLVMTIIGLLIMKYAEPIVRTFGKSAWAEQHLGGGGSYTLWKLSGLAIIILGALYLLGVIDFGTWNNVQLDQYN